MKKYKVIIRETFYEIIEVEANDELDAEDKAFDILEDGKIYIDKYEGYTMEVAEGDF